MIDFSGPSFQASDIRLENLQNYSACYERDSGVTHILDAGAAFILQQTISRPGIDRVTLLALLQNSFDDDPAALAALLDESLALLLRQGLVHENGEPDVM